ncbi:MAG: serine hydrolase [Bacteroidia bacterium]|nr:serine hydrolase [Bacteroidia bacterium]
MGRGHYFVVAALLILLGFVLAQYFMSEEEPVPVSNDKARAWADSVVKTLPLEALIGQLILSEQDTDSVSIDRMASLIRSQRTGGVLLPGASPGQTALLSNYFRSIAPFPLIFAISEPNAPRIHPAFPRLPAFLSVRDDSLLYTTGYYFGTLFTEMGINLELPGQTALFPPAFSLGMHDAGIPIGNYLTPDSTNAILFRDGWPIYGQGLTLCKYEGRPDSLPAVLEGGLDIVIAHGNEEKIVQSLVDAVTRRRIKRLFLEEKAAQVLAHKFTLAAAPDSILTGDSTRFAFIPEILGRSITEASLTLLRNDKQRIPFPTLHEEKVASLSIGNAQKTPFQEMLARYYAMEHFNLSSRFSQSELNNHLKKLEEFDFVIVGLHAGADTLKGNLVEFLQELQHQNRLIITTFGGSPQVCKLGFAQTLLDAVDDREITQQLAAQALFGGVAVRGRLWSDAGATFCQADGMDCRGPVRMKYTVPREVGMDPEVLLKVDSLAWDAISKGVFPGCQILAARNGKIIYEKSFGYHSYDRKQRVRTDDLYDVASITKIASTTLATMLAYEEKKISLDSTLAAYLPDLDSSAIGVARIDQILTHTSGLPEALPVYFFYTVIDSADSIKRKYYSTKRDSSHTLQVAEKLYLNPVWRDTIWERIKKRKLWTKGRYVYSDLGYFLMYRVMEKLYDKKLDQLVSERFYQPLGLQQACYLPRKRFEEDRIIPTENDRFYRRQMVHGYVHDMAAALWGGVSGQAGLFASAHDLAILMQLLLNGGEYGGVQYFSKKTVDKFVKRYDGHRGLGFDMPPLKVSSPSICSSSASRETFGHTGFTGCAVWADPKYKLTFVFLSNRVHPSARNQLINSLRIRQQIQTVFYESMGIFPPEDAFEVVDSTGIARN